MLFLIYAHDNYLWEEACKKEVKVGYFSESSFYANAFPFIKWTDILPVAKLLIDITEEAEVRENVIRAIARADSCYYHRDYIEEVNSRYSFEDGQALIYKDSKSSPKKPAAWIQLIEESKLVVGIRQTIDEDDWKTNRDCRVKNLDWDGVTYGKVHRGFYELAMDLMEQVDEVIQIIISHADQDIRPLEIHIGGFSQGAAVAFLIGFFLQIRYPYLKIKFALVAMPPCLDEEAAEKVDDCLDHNNISFYVLNTSFGEDFVYGGVAKLPFWHGKYRSSGTVYKQKVSGNQQKFLFSNPYSVHDLIRYYYPQLLEYNFAKKATKIVVKR